MNLLKRIFTLILLCVTVSGFAYDNVGHRIISDIAYQNLSKKARKQTDNVLGVKGIVYESSWADEIRSDNNYKYSYQWHYQNLKDNMTSDDLKRLIDNPNSEGEHLLYAINLMIERLGKDKNDAEALKFLVHFIGDMHQPMHLGRADDLGGNKVSMQWFGRNTNVHAVWDGQITDSKNMSSSEYATYLQNKFDSRKPEFLKYSELQSLSATYEIRNAIYAYDNSKGNNYQYIYRFSSDLDLLLYRAGLYLAVVLNGIYK